MYSIIIIVHVIVCGILIASILLQSGKGGGLAGLLGGGGSSQTIFGARASTFLTRATTVAAVAFLLTCISLTILSSRRVKSLMTGMPAETDVIPVADVEVKEDKITGEKVEWSEQEEQSKQSETEVQPVQE